MSAQTEVEGFRQQCRRQLGRPVSDRIRFGFFRNSNPVRDRGENRSFSTIGEYRRYCEQAFPAYFGYARPKGRGRPG